MGAPYIYIYDISHLRVKHRRLIKLMLVHQEYIYVVDMSVWYVEC